ncbi:putative hscarg dehydrogenase [Trichoderma velutinum]
MPQVLAVFGATGLQGNSVIDHVLNDAELSQRYKIRAITRDVNSDKANEIKAKNVEVIQGDVFDQDSLDKALAGVHTVFLMTNPSFAPDALEVEFNTAKNVADVSVKNGVQYIIFSTLPSVSQISRGKYTKVTMFDAKAKAESYIRSLPIKSAFCSLGSFMDNYITVAAPRKATDGSNTFIIAQHLSPNTRLPLIDAAGDTGKFIGSILAEPEKYEGKTIYGAERLYSLEEIAAALGKVTKENVVYKQISVEEFKTHTPFGADILAEAFSYFEEFGYYGKDMEELVASTKDNARGTLTTLEGFLEKRRPQLS